MGKLIGGIAGVVLVVWFAVYGYKHGYLSAAQNENISNTKWQVAINQVNDHVLQVGPIVKNEVTVTKVSKAGSTAAKGTYSGNQLIFTLESKGNLSATVTGNVAQDGKTMSGTIFITGAGAPTTQKFTAARLPPTR
jgi:hypothetical protein